MSKNKIQGVKTFQWSKFSGDPNLRVSTFHGPKISKPSGGGKINNNVNGNCSKSW